MFLNQWSYSQLVSNTLFLLIFDRTRNLYSLPHHTLSIDDTIWRFS